MSRGKTYTVVFSKDLRPGHTFYISLEDMANYSQATIFEKIMEELHKAGVSIHIKEAGRMSIENGLATYIIGEAWDTLFGEEEYDTDKLTDELNKQIKRIKKEQKEWEE